MPAFFLGKNSPSRTGQEQEKEKMGQLWTFLTHFHSFAGPTITLLYPLYASIRAIESPSKLDDEQWLAYWILYSFITLVEMVAEPVLHWIPVWYQMKVALVAWLVLPQFRGASFVYERFVREQLHKYGVHVSPKVKKIEHEVEEKKLKN